jgi:hypothetical protein
VKGPCPYHRGRMAVVMEKALVVMKDETTHVLKATPYEDFWGRVSAIPGPYSNVAHIYCSMALEKVLRKRWFDLNLAQDSDQRFRIKGLGELSLERAAALHAKLEDVPCQPLYP